MSSILITGVNRGIGRGLLEAYLQQPNTTVIGTVRDLSSATDLYQLPMAAGSKLLLGSLELTSETAPTALAADLAARGVSKLDVVISNAGLYEAAAYKDMTELDGESIMKYVNINAISVLRLFQGLLPLMRAAPNPKFAAITSIGGSIGSIDLFPISLGSYGASKALLNYFLRSMHTQVPDITTVIIHPGAVLTENAQDMAKSIGLEAMLTVSVDDSVGGIMKLVKEATKENSGIFYQWDGTTLPW